MASAATIALTMGGAIGQELPPATGLTPGAPLGSDPVSGEGAVVGETGIAEQAFVAPGPELPPQEPIAAVPMDEPIPAEPVGIAQPYVAPGAPVALAYPEIPSSAGLTPGAPLGSDAISDRKVVAGEEGRAIGGG
ncbi:MAG TPA: hypothetical protein VHG92_07760, partial [Afifellaceae bacterium]|nr:hypothetical protein [Afifellaceae bacterium]